MKKILLCYLLFVGFSNNSKAQEQPTGDLIHLSKQIDTIAKKFYLNKDKANYYTDSIEPILNRISFLGFKPDVPSAALGGFIFYFDEEKSPTIYSAIQKEIENLIQKEGLLFDYEKTNIKGFKSCKIYKLKNKAKPIFKLDRGTLFNPSTERSDDKILVLKCYYEYYFYM